MRWKQLQNMDVNDVLGVIGLARKQSASGVGSFFLGLGLGLVGGAVASVMLTPYKGSEAREKIARASEELGRTVSGKVNELAGNLKKESTPERLPHPPTTGTTSPYNQGTHQSTRIGSI